jgi:hypothetical protein
MPYQVSRSGPQTWNISPNVEHWDKFSWKNRSPSGFFHHHSVNSGIVGEFHGSDAHDAPNLCQTHEIPKWTKA